LHKLCSDVSCIEEIFNKTIDLGGEGVVIKDLKGPYKAGSRGWNWIKWKPEYVKGLRDTFDLVVVGAYYGKGRRAGMYGALLCAIYDKKTDKFDGQSPWVQDIGEISLPIAHAEGKFYATPPVLQRLLAKKMVAARYTSGDICEQQSLSPNPNGSFDNIASITDPTGRFLGMMPHPERATYFIQHPLQTSLAEQLKRAGEEVPEEGPGMKLFRNGVQYFD